MVLISNAQVNSNLQTSYIGQYALSFIAISTIDPIHFPEYFYSKWAIILVILQILQKFAHQKLWLSLKSKKNFKIEYRIDCNLYRWS